MFTNSEGCTIWEKTIQNRAPAYVRHTTGRIYWEAVAAQKPVQSGNSATRSSANSALCIIPAGALTYLPKPDDRIVNGFCDAAQPPPGALTVMSVKDFRYGSLRVQHVEVIAE